MGETPTADTSGIGDDNGLTNVTYSYQWIRNDGGTDTDIMGATDSSYTPVAADEGKTIKVKVTFTDDEGNGETLTSNATDLAAARPNSPATGSPTISGTAQVGETLMAEPSGIADTDWLASVSYSYQRIRNYGSLDTYTLVDADKGNSIKVRGTFTDDRGNGETLTSAATGEVAALPSPNLPVDVLHS